jgi:hypothetical protein
MSHTMTTNADGSVTISEKYYDLTDELKQIFPINYTLDTESSYLSRVKIVSDLVEYCAKLAIEKELG